MTRGLTAGVDTDDIDELINELNKSINGVYESNEAINNIVVKQPIIHTAESFYEISEKKKLTQQIYLKILILISIVDPTIKVT